MDRRRPAAPAALTARKPAALAGRPDCRHRCGDVDMHVPAAARCRTTLSAIRLAAGGQVGRPAGERRAPLRRARRWSASIHGNCSQKRCASPGCANFSLANCAMSIRKKCSENKTPRSTRELTKPVWRNATPAGSGTVPPRPKKLELCRTRYDLPFTTSSVRPESRFSAGAVGRQFGVCYALGITEVIRAEPGCCLAIPLKDARPPTSRGFEHERARK